MEGEQGDGENLPLIPATSFTNTLRIELEKASFLKETYTFVTLKTTLDQDKTGVFETITPGYSLLSAGLGGNFNLGGLDLGLRIAGSNLLDKTYISHLSRLKPDGIPNMGRNVTVSLKASL
ncbi:hypothetical protein [Antarcticibacterium sp. 1MA-6-2]|uniref:hypothetical protein n=1 Tax=Antarcticibacterium sp. 1MA-6-2 TaxID=2908210 RepID=UPI002882EC03|nr:hypothetical protein [Antarcticibacterium sp. 1MA-6-2]